jgi:hypothetical protein
MDGDPNKQNKNNVEIETTFSDNFFIFLLLLPTFWLRWLICPDHEVDGVVLDNRHYILSYIGHILFVLLLFTQVN